MSNQAIDGVLAPRELLESAWEISVDTWSRAEELRTLLDAPAMQWLAMEVNGKPWVIKEGPNADKWRAMGYELFPVEPAGQNQGEPVAWTYCPECGCEEIHHQQGRHKQCADCHQEWFSDIDYSDVVRGHLKKLKAEQPAPVAVVLPERKSVNTHNSHDWDEGHTDGWKAYDAELKRLPLQSQPL